MSTTTKIQSKRTKYFSAIKVYEAYINITVTKISIRSYTQCFLDPALLDLKLYAFRNSIFDEVYVARGAYGT